MSRIEDRVGEACREAADTVAPESVRYLDLQPGRRIMRVEGAARRRPGGMLAPLAAAASVAVIAVGAMVVVPALVSSAPHPGKSRHTRATAPAGLAALPKYTVLSDDGRLDVLTTATGRAVGQVPHPAGQAFAAMVGTADDRTFFVATDLNPQTSCQAFFYKFSLSSAGQPSALTPLPVHHLPGLPTALAASANGHLLGYSVDECPTSSTGHISSSHPLGDIGIIDLTAGKITRQWWYSAGEDYTTDLAMSADGRLLSYSNYFNAKYAVGRVLAVNAPAGPDERYSHIVMRLPTSTTIGANGHLMYAITGARIPELAAYDTTSGQKVNVLHLWPANSQLSPLVADPAGGYALLSYQHGPAHKTIGPFVRGKRCMAVAIRNELKCEHITVPPTKFISVNLTTGAVTTLPFHVSGPVGWGMLAW